MDNKLKRDSMHEEAHKIAIRNNTTYNIFSWQGMYLRRVARKQMIEEFYQEPEVAEYLKAA